MNDGMAGCGAPPVAAEASTTSTTAGRLVTAVPEQHLDEQGEPEACGEHDVAVPAEPDLPSRPSHKNKVGRQRVERVPPGDDGAVTHRSEPVFAVQGDAPPGGLATCSGGQQFPAQEVVMTSTQMSPAHSTHVPVRPAAIATVLGTLALHRLRHLRRRHRGREPRRRGVPGHRRLRGRGGRPDVPPRRPSRAPFGSHRQPRSRPGDRLPALRARVLVGHRAPCSPCPACCWGRLLVVRATVPARARPPWVSEHSRCWGTSRSTSPTGWRRTTSPACERRPRSGAAGQCRRHRPF